MRTTRDILFRLITPTGWFALGWYSRDMDDLVRDAIKRGEIMQIHLDGFCLMKLGGFDKPFDIGYAKYAAGSFFHCKALASPRFTPSCRPSIRTCHALLDKINKFRNEG